MSDTVIKAEGIGKKYRIGALHKKHDTLRDSIASAFKRSSAQTLQRSMDEEFWALKDVSFEVKQGEVVGIIGRNGAGKSTLLKILSRITDPTAGRVELHGRVGSLLEVGTGFHPELTGRENIFLNGAILGMSRADIRRKFDEIVSFAEVEKFIDTPVKHYSSGMYMRLAFAVAAHLEPEIMLVDEVLAVGDAQFQKKCLGKMEEVSHEQGKTILFVSHYMQAIRQLCSKGILLTESKISCNDRIEIVVNEYLNKTMNINTSGEIKNIIKTLPSDPVFKLETVNLKQNAEEIVNSVANGTQLEIEIQYLVLQKTVGLRVYFDLYDVEGLLLFSSFHDEKNEGIQTTMPGSYTSKAVIPPNFLGPIRYSIVIQAGIYNIRMCLPTDLIRIPIQVHATGEYNRSYPADTFRGKLAPSIPWTTSVLKG